MSDIQSYGAHQQAHVVHPAAVYQPAPLTPYGERPAIVYVPDAYGQMVPMLRDHAPAPMQPTPPRDLTPQPLIDPRAQVIAAGGVFAAGAGWGVGQALSALAGLGSGALMWLAIAIVAAKMAPAVSRTSNVTNVTNTNRWFGKSTTRI
ncbi:hypothetical protein PV409_37850 [Streptomyces sp. ME02-6979.5a]|uniref:hypothetical protein n=1 Tax=unclassified Streptomyces TaxID=2593676 RepID=UPI0029A79EFB|nr:MULTISPECIES: hypothetical protein [unclassified Streptomyces]MDX3343718.1 hypothetical protein [Streptomyces sp. ME02-6979.5a]MDX5526186.1 hypothetical protein [Streptomyces sp. DE06-01C]